MPGLAQGGVAIVGGFLVGRSSVTAVADAAGGIPVHPFNQNDVVLTNLDGNLAAKVSGIGTGVNYWFRDESF